MRRLLSSLLLLAVPSVLLAQQTIVHGTVVDQQSGAPIAGASVVVTGTRTGTVTNEAGAFSVSSSGAIVSLTVSAIGYAGMAVQVTAPGQALRIRLAPSPTPLPGVQIVANKPTPSTSVLTKSDLDVANGLSLTSSINAVPGVFMQARTPWGGSRITIRGYYPSTSGNSPNSNGLGYQVFLDDIPVTDATGTTILDDIDYSSLSDVEVIKGPASSQYGSFIGGAVRLTTERPAPNQTSLSQQVLSGTDGLLRTNTTYATANGTSDIELNYGHQGYDSFRPHSGSLKEYLRASADYEVSSTQTVSAYFSYARSYEELAGEIDSSDFYARDPLSNPAYLANDSHIAATTFLGGVTDHYQFSDAFTNKTTLFGSGLTFNQPFAHGFTDNNQINFGVRSVFGYATRFDNGVSINGDLGLTMQRSNVMTNGVFIIPAPPYVERPTDQENYAVNSSLFTDWNFGLAHDVTVTVGASLNDNRFAIRNMLQANQLYDTTTTQVRSFPAVFTPRATVTKGIGADNSVYASVSAGYTPPLLSNTIANNGAVDLSLEPERAVQYEVGTQGSLFDRRLTDQVSLFDIENTNKLVSETANGVTFTTNAGKQRNRGAEVALSFLAVNDKARALSMLRPWISYTYTDATFVDFKSDNNDNAGTVDFSGNAVPRVPKTMFHAGVDAGLRSGWYGNLTYQSVDKVPVTYDNSTYVKGYDLLGLKVGYSHLVAPHWKLDAFVGGDNLTNSTYYSFLFVGPNYAGLAQAKDGGTGDGYIIPAPYGAQYYGNISLSYIF